MNQGYCSENGSDIILDFMSYADFNALPSTWDIEFRDFTRVCVQYLLVPLVLIVGLVGNVVTIFILTRKNMRSSSNIYLTALAVSDMFFLIFSFIMSWKHYPIMEGVWLYWKCIPLGLWITDASCSTSIWLAVTFTTERYIAVCYPMLRKVYFTDNCAKYAVTLVYVACFILTASTPFEWKSVPKLSTQLNTAGNITIKVDSDVFDAAYVLGTTELGDSREYRFFYNWMTILVFIIVPFCLLSILNFLLVKAVQKSRKIRESMTPFHLQNQIRIQAMRKEDRITITLIAVVLMFLVCQMPTALVLIYISMTPPAEHESFEENILLGLGNIFNLFVSINAACNFLLYTALCDKYRKRFVEIILLNRFFQKQDNQAICVGNLPNVIDNAGPAMLRLENEPYNINNCNKNPQCSIDIGQLKKDKVTLDRLYETKYWALSQQTFAIDEIRYGLPTCASKIIVAHEFQSI